MHSLQGPIEFVGPSGIALRLSGGLAGLTLQGGRILDVKRGDQISVSYGVRRYSLITWSYSFHVFE